MSTVTDTDITAAPRLLSAVVAEHRAEAQALYVLDETAKRAAARRKMRDLEEALQSAGHATLAALLVTERRTSSSASSAIETEDDPRRRARLLREAADAILAVEAYLMEADIVGDNEIPA
jgi:indole-3-glycerol phosphate synthase